MFGAANTGIEFDKYCEIPSTVEGKSVPKAIVSFDEIMDIMSPLVMENIARTGFNQPTPVQRHSFPIMCAPNRRDMMATAQTGSGKTAAFLCPVISNMLDDRKKDPASYQAKPTRTPDFNARGTFGGDRMKASGTPQALVMAPTRELASQIHAESRKFTFLTGIRSIVIYGGASYGQQARQIEMDGVDLLIATPGRLKDMITRGKIELHRCAYMILDEAGALFFTCIFL